jgi:hypothetical protein
MFNGSDQVTVKSSLSFDQVCDRVEDLVNGLGPARFSNSGRFSIEEGRLTSFFTQVRYFGEVRQRKGGEGYLVGIDYEVAPSVACWVIGVAGGLTCLAPGLVFLFPLMAKDEARRAVERTIFEIDDELNR